MPAATGLVSYYESVLERFPKSGLAAARSVGLVSRIISLIGTVNSLIEKASCVAERSRGCRAVEGRVCLTGCGSIAVSPRSVWKYGSNAFSASVEDDSLRLATEHVAVIIEKGQARVRLPSSTDDKEEIVIDLTSVEGIMNEYYTIMYALKKVEEPLRKALEALNTCSREKQLAC